MAKAGRPAKGDDKPSFEALLDGVQSSIQRLESGELTLEQSLAEYERGVAALRACHKVLKQAEGRIKVITNPADEPEGADYDPETGESTGQVTTLSAGWDDAAVAEVEDDGETPF